MSILRSHHRARPSALAVGLVCLAGLLAPSVARAQQSLFNVPSTEGTASGGLFGQLQLSLTPSGGESNTTVDLGVLPWLEVGVNLLHVPLYGAPGPASTHQTAGNALTANASVLLHPASFMAVQVGVQAGVGGHPTSGRVEPLVFSWLTMRFEPPARYGAWVVGGYAGTRGALGDGMLGGGLLGFDLPFFSERLHLVADWIIGDTSVAVAVVGFALFVVPYFQVSAGLEAPSPGSGNEFGGVVELTYLPRRDHSALVASASPAPRFPRHFSPGNLQSLRIERPR